MMSARSESGARATAQKRSVAVATVGTAATREPLPDLQTATMPTLGATRGGKNAAVSKLDVIFFCAVTPEAEPEQTSDNGVLGGDGEQSNLPTAAWSTTPTKESLSQTRVATAMGSTTPSATPASVPLHFSDEGTAEIGLGGAPCDQTC